jgi:hypothetical protein
VEEALMTENSRHSPMILPVKDGDNAEDLTLDVYVTHLRSSR